MAKPIPAGLHSLTPHLVVRGAKEAIAFYTQAFGAVEESRMPTPDGGILHAQLRVGDSRLFVADEGPHGATKAPKSVGGSTASLMLYVENVDATYDQAVKAGATAKAPLQDMFWGDRWGMVEDPFGHVWQLATHKEDLTPEEMGRRAQAMFQGKP